MSDETPMTDDELGLDSPAEKPASGLSPDTENAVEELRRQIQAERQARAVADRRAEVAESLVEREQHGSRLTAIESGIDALDGQSEKLSREITDCHERGDLEGAAKKTRELANVEAKKVRLEEGRDTLKFQEQQREQQPQQRAATPDEIIANVERTSPRSAAFLRDRTDYIDRPEAAARLGRAHNDALKAGHEADSDEYFLFIDDVMTQASAPPPKREYAPPPPRRIVPAAPVSRDRRPAGDVRLSKEQGEMAASLGLTPKEYADSIKELQRTGAM